MKPRHAAALAMVAWYLLYPPWNAEKEIVDSTLALNRWYQVSTFDSSADCEARKFGILEEMDNRARDRSPETVAQQERLRHQARCVSADNPRLKGK
jgi:hypothetical protein